MATGTTDSWLGGAGDWSDAANWTLGVPGTADNASFGGRVGIDATITGSDTINALLDPANAGATLELDAGELTLLAGGTSAGAFELGDAAELALSAGTLALGGPAALSGMIGGPGTVEVTGSAAAALLTLTRSAVLLDFGTIGADGPLTLGTSASDAATLSIGAGGTLNLLGDYSIAAASAAAAIVNAGLFMKTAAGGVSFISAGFTNTGTIAVGLGTLALDAGNDRLGGAISGNGEFDLRGGGTYALAAGLALSVDRFGIFDKSTTVTLGGTLNYAGNFTLGNFSRLALGAQTLSLSGSADALLGTVAGPGTLAVLGTAEANLLRLTGGAVLNDRQTVVQDGLVQLGTGGVDAAVLTIAAGANYDLAGDVSLQAYGGATIANAGTFAKVTGAGSSIVFGSLASSGAILVDAGTLSLFGPVGTLAGTLAGAGELDLRGSGQFTLAAGIAVSVATLGVLDLGTAVTLAGPLDYAGRIALASGATLDLAGARLVLAGSAFLGGTIAGPGTVLVPGTADLNGLVIAGAAELDDQHVITQDGPLALDGFGGSALLTIEARATYELTGDDAVTGSGIAEILNAGLFTKIGAGAGTIGATVDNGGTIAIEQGTLALVAGLDNEALIEVGGFGAEAGIVVAMPLAGVAGSLRIGTGGTAVLETGAAAGETITSAGSQAVLELAAPAAVAGAITGFAGGDTIDLIGIGANRLGYANGTLTISESASGTLVEIAALSVPGIASPGQLALANDGSGGTDIELVAMIEPPPTVTADGWIAGSGNWSNAANWVLAGGTRSAVPGPGNDAVIAPAGTAAVAVAYNTVASVAALSGGAASGAPVTLAIGGGALTVIAGGSWSGTIAESAGSLDAVAGLTIGSLVLGSLATVEVDSGVLALAGGSLAGSIIGAGELQFEAGSFALQSGAAIAVATLDLVAGASVAIGGAFTYAGNFVLAGGAVALNGLSAGLGGIASLQGAIAGPGTLAVGGNAEVDGLIVSGSAKLDDRASITQLGQLTLGAGASDSSVLAIEPGAVYSLLAGAAIAAGGSAAAIVNAGRVEAGDGLDATISIAADITSTGMLDVAGGTLTLAGANSTLAGTLEGAGALVLAGGNVTLASGVIVQVGTLELGAVGLADTTTLATNLADAGALVLGPTGTLDLNGRSAALGGTALLAGMVTAGGAASALTLSGTAAIDGLMLSGPIGVSDTGTVIQEGALTLAGVGSGALSLAIAASATYEIAAGAAVAASGNVALSNAGLLQEIGGFATATITGNLVNTGTILVAGGTLLLAGGSSDAFAGTLAGSGEIDLEPAGTATLAPGLILSIATLGVYGDVSLGGGRTYGGDFVLGGSGVLATNGFSLVLSGAAALDGTVANGGGVTVTDSAQAAGLTLGGGATLDDAGMIAADGALMLGTAASDTASVVIGAGATFALLADANINATGAGVITNNGLLEVPGGSGVDYVFGNFTNAGTIAVAGGTLALMAGSAMLGGLVTGAGELDLAGGGTYTLASTLTLAGAALAFNGGADIVLGSNRSYGGELGLGPGTTLALNGHTLTVSAMPSLDGVVQGAGTLMVLGRANASGLILEQGAVLQDAGNIIADGAVTLGSGTGTAILDINAGCIWNVIADAGLAANGSVIVNNAGMLAKTGGTGSSSVAVGVDNTASIMVSSGTLAFAGNLANDGMILVAGGELVIGQSLVADSGRSGALDIGAGELVLQSSASSVETIAFTGGAGTLALAQPTRIAGTIGGFGNGDTIDMIGASFTAGADVAAFSGHVLSISNHGTTIATLNLAASYIASEFQLSGDGGHGTDIIARIPCFLAGTRILTPHGDVPVQRLAVGDLVTTSSGEARPIVWIGHRRIPCARHAAPETVLPVRIRAGAFAPDLPLRDLLLSPDHGVFAADQGRGVLIPAKHLINGISVYQERVPEAAYFHVELPAHDIVLAEALPVESYLDSGNRAEFGPGAAPHSAADNGRACAALCVAGPELAAVKRRLLARLAAERVRVGVEPELALVVAGQMIGPARIIGGLHRFVLPGWVERVRIVSRHGVPAELDAESTDRRRLGLAIEGIVLDERVVGLADTSLGAGFHGVERQGAIAWRWTDGDAEFVVAPARPSADGSRVLDLLIRAAARSWLLPAPELTRAA